LSVPLQKITTTQSGQAETPEYH
jgi:hypothetical protein